ncbi:T9SS type A sorting domain-containing protein [Gramella sp. BOM4]|nr:T9SS type A sorting domain-containing protein [Christiangramia bathymodioli]
MKHKYLLFFLLIGFLMIASPASAQDSTRAQQQRIETPIEGLSIYPNPVTGGKVYISSTKNQDKIIEVYNVLGKAVHKTRIRGKEMDVSNLTPGIYILKIQEGTAKSTRKLVVK